MSFSDELKAAAERDILRLHTPGHKGKLAALDLTELTDGVFPTVALEAAQHRAASIYGARHARFLCGGSSQGVKAALYYAKRDGIADINSHRSVFDGFALAGTRCVTVGERGSVYPITLKQIESALAPTTQAVIVTTPTYYGFCADVDGIADYCKKHGLLFIADSAHGAHFGFAPKLPNSVVSKADICNVSTHKTLYALTQSALLFDNLDDSESAKLCAAADVMGSTSPSYLLYASIDGAVGMLPAAETRAAYEALYAPIESLRAELPFLKNDDYTRLVLDCTALGVSADSLNAALLRRGVYGELNDGKRLVFIFTAADTPDTAERLGAAIADALTELK